MTWSDVEMSNQEKSKITATHKLVDRWSVSQVVSSTTTLSTSGNFRNAAAPVQVETDLHDDVKTIKDPSIKGLHHELGLGLDDASVSPPCGCVTLPGPR